MDYVFGTKGRDEILKTKGPAHSGLIGYRQIERIYPDQTITDVFHVAETIGSAEDGEGNCYDWYRIDHHYRTVDKSAAVKEEAAAKAGEIEEAMCEQDTSLSNRISDIEDALCDMDKAESEETANG